MIHRMNRRLIRTKLAFDERLQQMSGPGRDRGDAFAWVLIAAATVAIVAAVYAAINGKVLEKIGLIEGA